MNISQFEHITITGMDDKQTHPDDKSALYYVYLNLSKHPSPEWARAFNETWMNHIYMMKRRADVNGDCIIIHCGLEELQSDHLPELEKIVKGVNQRQEAAAIQAQADNLKAKQVEQETRKKIEDAASQFGKKG